MNGHDDLWRDEAAWDGDPAGGLTDWEQAAAACELAFVAGGSVAVGGGCVVVVEPLPASVTERIRDAAAMHMDRNSATTGSRSAGHSGRNDSALVPAPRHGRDGWFASRLVPMAGWCAAIGLGLALVWQTGSRPSQDGPRQEGIGVEQPATASLADCRQLLLAEDPAALSVAWTAGKDAAIEKPSDGAGLGDVVWSQSRQQGFMRFRGLAANDPTVEQYQLWIFDADRDAAYPVDGGVFDVAVSDSGDEIVVAIDPRLPVGKPTLFAITVEKPGGVVVSSRERLPLLAQVP